MTLRLSLLAVVGFLFAGCGAPEIAPATPASREVRVDWLGQQSFLITSALGTKIITNPYSGGFPGNQRPEIVLITTERSDCNNIDAFENTPTVFRGSVGIGTNTATGLRIRGIPTYKNPEQESPDSMNLVFVWTLEGMKFCFLGHLRNELTPSQVLQIGAVDVLFAPPGSAGAAAVSQLRPRVIIPLGRETFVSRMHNLPGSSVLLTRAILPDEPTVLVFGKP
jgi:L-ascorbate metabolism protein UlaG (beta-lactamase superfamily)